MQTSTTTESAPAAMRADADSEPSAAQLVAGMATDVKQLGESYLELLRLEAARTLRMTAQLLAAGLIALLGTALLAVGAALTLHENSELSLGSAYAIVGTLLGAAGVVVLITTARLLEKDEGR
jgi:hypothetical protein